MQNKLNFRPGDLIVFAFKLYVFLFLRKFEPTLYVSLLKHNLLSNMN